ncbi:MAG: BCD family MFS transporter [Beijerinckiaceae bacterium]
MMLAHPSVVKLWTRVSTRMLPFADVASDDLPLARLLRLSLFQVTVGMAMALMVGTLNRVMIVELGVRASVVALAIATPLIVSPMRALIGFKSDHHRSAFGWRRVPYIWFGTLVQFGGLSIMPFALLLLTGDHDGPEWLGPGAAALSFLLVGAGMQTVQTAGLALATDLAPAESRPRVVALMYVMLLVGMVGSGLAFGFLLADFSQTKLIQVVQGAALVTMIVNVAALWKQEPRDRSRAATRLPQTTFLQAWSAFVQPRKTRRFLLAMGVGTAAFSMQDVVLEPYGGEVLKLAVSDTSALTSILAAGSLVAYAIAARMLSRGLDPFRLAAYGILVGLPAFALVLISAPVEAPMLFRAGAALIGFGSGLFAVATLVAAMGLDEKSSTGLALGSWGAVQALSSGLAMSVGGVIRDGVSSLASSGSLGAVLSNPWTGYAAVYQMELVLLFVTLVVIGPLARLARSAKTQTGLGLAQLPR